MDNANTFFVGLIVGTLLGIFLGDVTARTSIKKEALSKGFMYRTIDKYNSVGYEWATPTAEMLPAQIIQIGD